MNSRLSLSQIREHWVCQAMEHPQSPSASWSDYHVIQLEINQLLKHLSDGDKVLDVGCGNGYTTVQLASERQIAIRGIDYVPEMIAQARIRLDNTKDHLRGTVDFTVGDVTDLDESTGSYDKVVSVRVIINLGDWNNQLRGIAECSRVLRPGGLLLLSEATLQGWCRLNEFRREWGLEAIPMPAWNEYLDEDRLVAALPGELELVDVISFSSTYFVGTRVLKPLLIRALGVEMDAGNPDTEWNRWFSQLPAVGDYGTQKLFVFSRL